MRQGVLVTLLLILTKAQLESQTSVEAGTLDVGGRARLSRLYDAANDVHEVGFEVAPNIGVFVVRGLAVSMNARLGWSRREQTASAFKWGLGPGVSYYLAKPGWTIYPFVELATLWLRTTFSPIGEEALFRSQENKERTLEGSVGGVLLLTRHVGLTGEGYYSRYRIEVNQVLADGQKVLQDNWSEEYGLRFGVRVFVF